MVQVNLVVQVIEYVCKGYISKATAAVAVMVTGCGSSGSNGFGNVRATSMLEQRRSHCMQLALPLTSCCDIRWCGR